DLYVEGMSHPIPLMGETAHAWQRNVGTSFAAATAAAKKAWETDRFAPEATDPANQLLFPHLGDTAALVAGDFPVYAERLWAPILPLLVEKKA
ncbi:MAG: hypothetical protein ACE5GC_07405, partial [Acidimicrobiia bacterium]